MSGRPRGPWSDKRFRMALQAAVTEKANGHPKLRKIAQNLVDAAMAGDLMAIKEVADRIDGKAHQTQSQDITQTVRMVVEAPPEAKDTDDWMKRVRENGYLDA